MKILEKVNAIFFLRSERIVSVLRLNHCNLRGVMTVRSGGRSGSGGGGETLALTKN